MAVSAADAVLAAHFAFVAFVAGGGLLVLRWPRVAWLHLPAAAWGALVEFAGWVCPLTYLEHALRSSGADGPSFVDRFVAPLLYPDWVQGSLAARIGLGVAVVAVNAAVYGLAFRRRRRARRRPLAATPSP